MGARDSRRSRTARHQWRRGPGHWRTDRAGRFFRIGSNTKTFISTVLLQLVGEHRVSLQDPVERWLPAVVHGHGNDGNNITLRQLLQHTSGLHNYTDDLQAQITSIDAYRELEFHQFSRQDLLDIALAQPPDFAPVTGWNYSNTNYILLGMIIEKVTGQSWQHEVTRRIIAPLGLRHTVPPELRSDAGADHTVSCSHPEAGERYEAGGMVGVIGVRAVEVAGYSTDVVRTKSSAGFASVRPNRVDGDVLAVSARRLVGFVRWQDRRPVPARRLPRARMRP